MVRSTPIPGPSRRRARSRRPGRVTLVAFCTAASLAALSQPALVRAAPAPATRAENVARYSREAVERGATSLDVPARLEWMAARRAMAAGDVAAARAHLERAMALAPHWPDPCFTLSGMLFRHFDPDALFYFVAGARAMLSDFRTQALAAVNAGLLAILLLFGVTAIAVVALAARYLPFAAYRLGEILEARTRAAWPRATALVLLLVPFALLPGLTPAWCLTVALTWAFMHRRERAFVVALAAPWVALAVLAPRIDEFAPAADPTSLAHRIARADAGPATDDILRALEATRIPGLEVDRDIARAVLHTRRGETDRAAALLLEAISRRPGDAVAYIDLGNVYYARGDWQKALEGYRKAVQIDPDDPVAQYNLAQAYIRALLLGESSRALRAAAAAGVDRVRAGLAEPVREKLPILPRPYEPRRLWRVVRAEGRAHPAPLVDPFVAVLCGRSARSAGWWMLAAIVAAMALARWIPARQLAFQCSNCGALTSEATCSAERGPYLCAPCAAVIDGVTSDKVVEALLRQRRQKVLVRRRRLARMLTAWLPGMRDFYYARIARGLFVSALFTLSLAQLILRGAIVRDWTVPDSSPSIWTWIVPAAGVALAWAMTLLSRHYHEVRNYRSPAFALRSRESEPAPRRRASA